MKQVRWEGPVWQHWALALSPFWRAPGSPGQRARLFAKLRGGNFVASGLPDGLAGRAAATPCGITERSGGHRRCQRCDCACGDGRKRECIFDQRDGSCDRSQRLLRAARDWWIIVLLHGSLPCVRLWLPAGTPPFSTTIDVHVTGSACRIPTPHKPLCLMQRRSPGLLGYITMWPQGQAQPLAATLNSYDGAVTNNMAIVPTTNGSISVFPSQPTHLVLDIFGYLAP